MKDKLYVQQLQRRRLIWLLLLGMVVVCNCGHAQNKSSQTTGNLSHEKGLKDYYQSYFPIGVAVSARNLEGDESKLILTQFNSITPENCLKTEVVHPEENRYNWTEADKIVKFSELHGLRVRGHNLCWHEQNPAWLFLDSNGKTASKEIMLKRLKDHILTVVGRYKGRIYAWDVVNEAVDDDPDNALRPSQWLKICGDDYIAKAFEYAHEADPDALLFYNDYNTERPEKVARICKLLKKLKDAKVPIHGIGLQAHWSIFEPSEKELRAAIAQYAALGLKIQFTELDVSIYPWEKAARKLRSGETDVFTPELEKKQIEKYAMIFKVLRDCKSSITGITFWNVSDRHSWLDDYPVAGRKNYPLLFSQDLTPKKAFWEVVKF